MTRQFFLLLAAAVLTAAEAGAQAMLPSIMVRPGKAWCQANGYTTTRDNQGRKVADIDYAAALNDMKMLQSITTLEAMLKAEGFVTVNMRSRTDAIDLNAAEDMLDDDEDGSVADKTALDVSREQARADIYLDINWEVEKIGPKKQLSYVLESKDFYTNDEVCSVDGIGEPSMSASEAVLLKEAVVGKMGTLKERLGNYMQDLRDNGRPVTIVVKVQQGASRHLQSPTPGGNLGRAITTWLKNNAVAHRVVPSPGSRTSASYRVNIPLYGPDELGQSAEDFAYQLSDFLAAAPYNVKTRVSNRGLGYAVVYIK